MTMCFLSWDPASRVLQVANAGQEQPLILQNGRCEKIPLAGFPVGMFDDSTYDDLRLKLSSGDILVLYSDGVTDVQDAAGQFYGWQRLRDATSANAALSAAEIADRLLADVDQFSGGVHPFDDRTLVVLKVI